MAKEEQSKILRIGIIQDRRVVEERLLRKHGDVTIGQAPKNTFIVPNSSLPRSFLLFEARPRSYALVFERSMEGRIDLGDSPMTLRELSHSSEVSRRGNKFVLPLTDTSRGKVVFGDVTLLFQYVDAPPVLPKTQLPAAARGGIASQLEWPLIYILALSFLILGGWGAGLDVWWRQTGQYLEVQYGKRKNKSYELLRAEVRQEKIKDEETEKPKEEAKEEIKEEAKEEVKPQPTPPKPKRIRRSKPKAVKRETNRRKMTAKVRGKTFLRALGKAAGEGPGALAAATGTHKSNLDDAFNLSGGVTSGTGSSTFIGGPSAANRSGSAYKTLGKGEAGGRIATKTVKTASKDRGKEIRVRANVSGGKVGGKTGTGTIDKGAVARVFSRRKGAIKYCYEKALKTTPNLKGKVTIRFTIGSAGRITSISATSNTTGNPGVAQCIVGKVRGWRFEPPQGGSVTFSYPFLLETR